VRKPRRLRGYLDVRGGSRGSLPSLLLNTMTAGLNCDVTGAGHSHKEEHCMFGLLGSGVYRWMVCF